MHYANLTEYVAETDEIMELARDAQTGFVLQTGLAPGFINVLAMSLYNEFVANTRTTRSSASRMKVGALTAHAHAAFLRLYLVADRRRDRIRQELARHPRLKITERPALSARETIVIGARTYEADLTSGGAADLPDFFVGKARSLDYKTLRYVGHYEWVERQVEIAERRKSPESVAGRYAPSHPVGRGRSGSRSRVG
ncbi:MAG: hypothetical protein IPK58_18500 [Acidobacteria bacterium]|nr:hypothetical protein [Acidobacteriota bacterium]